jgi:hypothetical protein
MASLISPGVDVQIIDESQYLSAPTNSVPFILLATAENKANPSRTGIAPGTTSANAGKLFQITSQRDLVNLFGNPFFYTNAGGSTIQGFELNEYGLLAAYSALGVSNRVFCLRADIDLASLVGQVSRPVGDPEPGSFWLDTTTSTWGINVFNAVTGQFTPVDPIIIEDSALLDNGFPLQSIGIPGNYAVNAIPDYDFPSATNSPQFFYKNENNVWVALGSKEWLGSWPTVRGTATPNTLTPGDTFTVNLNGQSGVTYTVPTAPDNTLQNLVATINSLEIDFLKARVANGRLELFSRQTSSTIGNTTPNHLTISGTGNILSTLGIPAGTYYQPGFEYGTSSQRPLWQSGQVFPRPTGSVWIRIGGGSAGLNTVVSEWNSVTRSWVNRPTTYAISDIQAINQLDSAGGKNIPAGTIYTQYNFNYSDSASLNSSPLYYWRRIANGPTVVTGTVTNPNFTGNTYQLTVQVSIPGSTATQTRTVNMSGLTNAASFVNAWNSAAIPFTIASVTSDNRIRLTHTEGGVIILNDFNNQGLSTGFLNAAGFTFANTIGVKEGPSHIATFNNVPATLTSGLGTGATFNVSAAYEKYYISMGFPVTQGTGYQVGDTITIAGTSLGGLSPANDLVLVVTKIGVGGAVSGVGIKSGKAAPMYTAILSNWVEFDMVASKNSPVTAPKDGTNWFYSVVDEVDILVNTPLGWRGYRNVAYDANGFPLPSGTNMTDPNGPIISTTAPVTQSNGQPLQYGDLWIDTSDLENYPVINRWQQVDGKDQWVRLVNGDRTSEKGIVFADVRWGNSGNIDPASDNIPTITSLLTSDYIDLDAPSSALFPVGMLVFNTRRSGYNVKRYIKNYFNSERFGGAGPLPAKRDAWVSVSGLKSDGSPNMGRKAQRAMVVAAMKAAIDSNTALRDEDNFFNLIAAPGYPELQPNMIALNNDRGQTAFIIGDTPMRLSDSVTEIQDWATNAKGATSTGEEGLVNRDPFLGIFYPSGLTNDLNGNSVVVPASHMMIRTFLRNDDVSFPWFAPAGTRRGIIDNASGIGYIDKATGEFRSIKTRVGVRDVLYNNQINPLVFFTGNGLLNYGNKTSAKIQSSLDRINVARLVAYLRRQLTIASRPFIFEPNDALTRQEITGVIQSLLADLVAKRGIFDYIVVCDESNNTPARIDRNELWVDVAVEPAKAVEFIYIPIRLFNTGEINNR